MVQYKHQLIVCVEDILVFGLVQEAPVSIPCYYAIHSPRVSYRRVRQVTALID
jgi:hypothetical protein